MDGAQVPGPSVEWWHVLSRSLRFAAKILYEIMLFKVSMLDETGSYTPSMAHIILAPPSLAGHFCVLWEKFLQYLGSFVLVKFRYGVS